jgi:uncharacterized membrane protein (GlpM family)
MKIGGLKIEIDTSRLGESRWYEYVVRFAFGGGVTAVAGLIAKRYGPAVGGLFLAFPAIFPATATLIEKHEKERKEREGKKGTQRARSAVGMDAIGTALGAIALIVFAGITWSLMPNSSLPAVLLGAMAAWLFVAGAGWVLWQMIRKHLRTHRKHSKNRLEASLHVRPSSNRRM